MSFYLDEDFLLTTPAAQKLYHEYAAHEPIYDYHTHLPVDQIAANRRYHNLHELWLEGDHYKWRAMRANGIPERFITGDATPKEKFLAYAETVPHTLRNPLYHWTHLELKRFFCLDVLLGPDTAEEVWSVTEEMLKEDAFSCQRLLEDKKVRLVCSTDDPVDTLEYHEKVAENPDVKVKVYPTFRPDAALRLDRPEAFKKWLSQLEQITAIECTHLNQLCEALRIRHDYFHQMGCRLSDHGMTSCEAVEPSEKLAIEALNDALAGRIPDAKALEHYRAWMMLFFGQLDAEKGWTKQLHLGPLRNNNTRLFESLGPDIGCDSLDDGPHAVSLNRYLDLLTRRNHLPKTIVYNLNPKDNYTIATAIGNFQGGIHPTPGKIQFGSGWWFLDTYEGMRWQLNALSHTGLLSRFVGMLTDSRSFLSSARHEYFRRILCDLVGEEVEKGLLPRDWNLVGGMIKRICWQNAVDYFGMEV